MNKIFRLIFISVLMFVVAPAWADRAIHIYHCEQEDEATDEALSQIASEWLKAAKTLKGGANIEIFVYFPVAVEIGEQDFLFMITAPSFEEMGAFIDAYEGSPLEDIDDRFDELAACPNSSMWEAITIK